MTEPRDGATDQSTANPLAAPAPVGESEPGPPPSDRRPAAAAWWLAGLLVLVIIGIVASPLWAPAIMPLLPWGDGDHAGYDHHAGYDQLADRVAALEQRPVPSDTAAEQTRTRLDALSTRVDRLQKTPPSDPQAEAAAQKLDQRVSRLETRMAAPPAIDPAAITKLQHDTAQVEATTADLDKRLTALDQRVRAQAGADRTAAGLLLAFLQIREAVDAGRPFAAAYAAFTALAHSRPAVIAAASPLGNAAHDGVPGRVALAQQLAALARPIATAPAPVAGGGWRAEALARLRGLVTIRRIGAADASSPDAMIERAQQALAHGDLAGAVADLGGLTGTAAAAARPWLQAANQRLSVEKSLDALEALLVADLDNPMVATPAPGNLVPGAPPAPAPPPSTPTGSRS